MCNPHGRRQARDSRAVASVVWWPLWCSRRSARRAHHSIVPFDTTTFIELEGEISEVSWRNPHVRLKMRVRNEAGATEEWDLEGDSANASVRRGLTREPINVSDRVRIAGNPSNRCRRELLATNILFADGVERLMTAGRSLESEQVTHLQHDVGRGGVKRARLCPVLQCAQTRPARQVVIDHEKRFPAGFRDPVQPTVDPHGV